METGCAGVEEREGDGIGGGVPLAESVSVENECCDDGGDDGACDGYTPCASRKSNSTRTSSRPAFIPCP